MPKRDISPVENKRVLLRLLEKDDLPLTLKWRNQDHIRKWFLNSNVIPEEKHYAWFENYKNLDNDFIFIIIAKDLKNLPVGQVSLYGIDWEKGSAEYGRLMVGEDVARGRGYAKEATSLILKLGFDVFRLREVYLKVLKDNLAAQKVYRDCGFLISDPVETIVQMAIRNY